MDDTVDAARGLRALDIVVYGATGYTGRLVAHYLATRAPQLRVALAGRSLHKLHAVRAELPAAWHEIPLLVCSGDNKQALAQVAVQTSVLIACAGPFLDNGGLNVAEACVHSRTHYVDSTGEPEFYRLLEQRLHERAVAAGVCVVPAAGMDSLPWDLGVYAATHSRAGALTGVDRVEVYADVAVQPSAGTIASALSAIAHSNVLGVVRMVRDAWYGTAASWPRTSPLPFYSHVVKTWALPVLVTLDMHVARRTLSLLRRHGGAEPVDVHLGQYIAVRSAFAPLLFLLLYTVALPLLVLVGKIAVLRNLVLAILRRWGREGPTPQERAKAYVKMTAIGWSKRAIRRVVNVSAPDPGYGSTAKWIAETAILLLDVPLMASDSSKGVLVGTGGVLTPASCFGYKLLDVLVERGAATIST